MGDWWTHVKSVTQQKREGKVHHPLSHGTLDPVIIYILWIYYPDDQMK